MQRQALAHANGTCRLISAAGQHESPPSCAHGVRRRSTWQDARRTAV